MPSLEPLRHGWPVGDISTTTAATHAYRGRRREGRRGARFEQASRSLLRPKSLVPRLMGRDHGSGPLLMLKQVVAGLTLDNRALKDIATKTGDVHGKA